MVIAGMKMEMPRENIRWDLHERHLQSVFAMHFLQDRFCDVTLVFKDGQTIRAHRTILCACSGYFDTVLTGETSGKETLVIMKDCDYQDIQLLIQFMYYGEINVDENRLRSLLRTADGLRINGLTEAFLNSNDNAALNITPAVNAAAHSFVGYDEFENEMDKKEPDWSDNEDENDCVRVYLVSEDEEDFDLAKKQTANVDAFSTESTLPKSSLPIRDIQMKRSNRNTVASTNRLVDPLDGQMELDDGGDFNGWYLTPVDNKDQQDERKDPVEVGSTSITKKMGLKNILSRSRNRPKQVLVPSLTANIENIENRNAVRLASKCSQPAAERSSEHQPEALSVLSKPSTESSSLSSTIGTNKMVLLERLQRSIQRSYDGRIRGLKLDDLQNYFVENGKGSCRFKCPVCDELIKLHYAKYGSRKGNNSQWAMSNVTTHLRRHFK